MGNSTFMASSHRSNRLLDDVVVIKTVGSSNQLWQASHILLARLNIPIQIAQVGFLNCAPPSLLAILKFL